MNDVEEDEQQQQQTTTKKTHTTKLKKPNKHINNYKYQDCIIYY